MTIDTMISLGAFAAIALGLILTWRRNGSSAKQVLKAQEERNTDLLQAQAVRDAGMAKDIERVTALLENGRGDLKLLADNTGKVADRVGAFETHCAGVSTELKTRLTIAEKDISDRLS